MDKVNHQLIIMIMKWFFQFIILMLSSSGKKHDRWFVWRFAASRRLVHWLVVWAIDINFRKDFFLQSCVSLCNISIACVSNPERSLYFYLKKKPVCVSAQTAAIKLKRVKRSIHSPSKFKTLQWRFWKVKRNVVDFIADDMLRINAKQRFASKSGKK